MFKSIKDIWDLNNIASTYLLSNIIKIPVGERFQVNINTFIRCLSMPENPIGNIFIIQGGVLHMNNTGSYYIKTTCSLLPKNLRVFVFETLYPMTNFEFAHDVADCLTYIKTKYPGKIYVIGFSMGGFLLFTYLSLGYDQADLYIPICCPLDMDRFMKVISDNALFRILQKRACDRYNVKSYEELMHISGSSLDKSFEFNATFISNLNLNKNNWIHKTIYILSSNDPITSLNDLDLLESKPLTYIIIKGWHCCLESIVLAIKLINSSILDSEIKT